MGWVKRSSGHRCDSDSGCATAIEQNSGKIVSFEIKAKFCNTCELQKEKQQVVTDADWQKFKKGHDCKENWGGKSSKSMEAGAVCDMALRAPQDGAKFTPIISDDDSSMRAWMKEEGVNTGTSKGRMPKELAVDMFLADPSHRTKVFAKGLYLLAGKKASEKPGHGGDKVSKMNKEVAAKLKQYHAYVLGQHKDKTPLELQTALLNIVDHAFNEHGNCGEWCPAKQAQAKGETHAPGGFIRKEYLHGEALRAAILEHVKKFASLPTCTESTHPYHSQGNEAFNQRASSKAPKNVCYGRTGSYTRRICLSVAEHNVGVSNNYSVLEALDINPGVNMRRLLENFQQKVNRKVFQAKSREMKQRRKHNKGAHITQNRKENPTNKADYGSGVGFGLGQSSSAPYVAPASRKSAAKRRRVPSKGTKGKSAAVGPSSDDESDLDEDIASDADEPTDATVQLNQYSQEEVSDQESEQEEELLPPTRAGRSRKPPRRFR
jgi:hypothetical protein